MSYAHDDALAFVRQLVTDIERDGHRVWWDQDKVMAGAHFDVKIERAIRQTDIFFAVVTKRSQEEDSICRDEVVYAFVSKKPIVPVRLTPHIQPGLLLARRSWVDFTKPYETSLESLLRYLRGNEGELTDPELGSISGAEPIDFAPEIARYVDGFTGREWFGLQFEDWLRTPNGSMMVVLGTPGAGKSAIAAWICLKYPVDAVGIHFCSYNNPKTLSPIQFVASLVAQLHARLPGFVDAVNAREPASMRTSSDDAFHALIVEPLHTLPQPGQPKFVVVDALDESAFVKDSILDMLVRHERDLPPWFRVVATSRPELRVQERFAELSATIDLAMPSRSRTDVRLYAARRIQQAAGTSLSDLDANPVLDRIATASDGNFLIARLLLDGLEEGVVIVDTLDRVLPGQLAAFYSDDFYRRFPDTEQFRRELAPLLRALVAARDTLPSRILDRIAVCSVEEARARIRQLRPFLRVEGSRDSTGYKLFHLSLADWLTNPEQAGPFFVDRAAGHAALAAEGWREYTDGGETSNYMFANLAVHLLEASCWQELLTLVMSGVHNLIERWTTLGEGQSGLRCLQGLVKALERDRTHLEAVAGLSTQIARIHALHGNHSDAEVWLQTALRKTEWLYRARRVRAIAYHELASLSLARANRNEAVRRYRKALRICLYGFPRLHDEAAANLVALAVVAAESQRPHQVISLAIRALMEADKGNDIAHQVAARRLLAVGQRALGNYSSAAIHVAAGLAQCNEHRLALEAQRLLVLRAWVNYDEALLRGGNVDAAEADLREALERARKIGSLYGVTNTALGIAWCLLVRGDTDGATSQCDDVDRLLPLDRWFDVRAGVAVCRAGILRRKSDALAEAGLKSAIEFCSRHQTPSWEMRACIGLGAFRWHAGRTQAAQEDWRRAQQISLTISPAKAELVRRSIELCQEGRDAVGR